jgi:hypothetical protein
MSQSSGFSFSRRSNPQRALNQRQSRSDKHLYISHYDTEIFQSTSVPSNLTSLVSVSSPFDNSLPGVSTGNIIRRHGYVVVEQENEDSILYAKSILKLVRCYQPLLMQ